MKTKDQWEDQRREAHAALGKIELAERKARNANLVGKCFRYANSYGSGSRWWLYGKVLGIDAKSGWPKVFSFETTDHDIITIEPGKSHMSLGSDWKPITQGEYNKAWRALQKRIAQL